MSEQRTPGELVEIADDGVQEVPLTAARPLLTRLIEQVREDDLVSALTVRGRRRVYLVTPDFYEQAMADRKRVESLET
ncbi:type II toxin-antitoxin system prevent-host-death family antitoxin [Embleya sp. NPDC001921]